MISFGPSAASLEPARRFALDLLLDASRLLRVAEGVEATISVEVRADLPGSVLAPGLHVEPGRVLVPGPLLDDVVAVAGAGTEQASAASDRHGRVPAEANPLAAAGREREPVVSQAARELRGAAARAAGDQRVWLVAPWPRGHRWAAAVTHDLDVVDWWPVFTAARVAETARRGRVGLSLRILADAARAGTDPVGAAALRLLGALDRRGIRGTWFVIAGRPGWGAFRRGDVTYAVAGRRARWILAQVRQAGHEIGLHGSFATAGDTSRFTEERARLAAVTGAAVQGARQHFLRMRPGTTQRAMIEAGLAWDATYGFADRNGFRLGVADVVPGWDAASGARSGLDEVPLVWMDRALSKYRGLEDPAAWVDDGLELAGRAREVDGLWVGLWHPNLAGALGFPGAEAEFERLLDRLGGLGAWLAPLGEIVAWRRRRRGLRAVGVGAGGVPLVRAEDSEGEPLDLEVEGRDERVAARTLDG